MRSFFCLLWVGLWLFTSHSTIQAARVAGEEGVSPTAPKPTPEVATPTSATSPSQTGPQQRAAPEEEETDQGKASTTTVEVSEPAESDERSMTIDFDDVDIRLFIKYISEQTGKNFVIDTGVKGNVTIICPTKITAKEAYKVFESVLEVHGYTTVPAGNIIKIVPAAEARGKDVETKLRQEATTPEDKVVTQLIPLRFADPDEIKKLFAPLISKNSVMVSYPPTGMLIVTDVQSNIGRLIKIIEAIDVEGIGEEICVLPLQYATASTMAKSLGEVFQKTGGTAQKGASSEPVMRIVPDDRTNVLIILATEDDTVKARELIALLDKETPRGEGDVHVYYLQNANAEDLAKTLATLPTQQAQTAQKAAASVISREVQIVPDKATNALVITANKDDYLVLEDVIESLDIPRRMVLVEALLMEVDVKKDFDVGVEWQAGESVGSHDGKEITAFGSSIKGTQLEPIGSGFSFGVLGDVITLETSLGNVSFPSIAAVIRALQTEQGVNILSKPQITVLNNEEAEIVVAKNVPYQTRVETTGEVTGREFATYEYKDVGVTLNITPQINQEGVVRLKISQEVSQVVEEESVTGLPTTLKRVAKTVVDVKDKHTVVIGGLIDRTLSRGTTKTPCLGNIPGLGWLFKSHTTSADRTNLYVFITPHIIERPEEADELYQQKKEEIESIEEGVIKMYDSRDKEAEDMQLSH